MPKKKKEQNAETVSQSIEANVVETNVTEIVKVKTKRTIGHEERTNRTGYLFILPFIIAFLIFNFWPTINTILLSFTDLTGFKTEYVFSNADCPTCRGYGEIYESDALGNDILDAEGNPISRECDDCKGEKKVTPIIFNYSKLLKDTSFWSSLGNTFIIWGFNFAPQLGIALILAIWLSDTRLNLAGQGLFRAVIYMPNLLMAASVALLFRTFFGAFGHINAPAHQFLRFLNIHWMQTFSTDSGPMIEYFNFFRSVWFSRGLVAFIQWWMWYGHTLIMLMAGITSIPISLYESAVVDGANSRQTAWYITLPLLRPMMLYILVTSMIGGMQMFEIPFLLTDMRGGPAYKIRTTVLYQYNIAFQGVNNRSYGATISVGIFLVTIFFFFFIYFFLQDRSEMKKNKIKIKKGGAI
jgi:multiple sugar transport system permease protein